MPQSVTCPMPGVIFDVLVSEGQKVEADQPVLILEAMKMENEILAPEAGTVKKVAVKKGDSVEAEALLIELE